VVYMKIRYQGIWPTTSKRPDVISLSRVPSLGEYVDVDNMVCQVTSVIHIAATPGDQRVPQIVAQVSVQPT